MGANRSWLNDRPVKDRTQVVRISGAPEQRLRGRPDRGPGGRPYHYNVVAAGSSSAFIKEPKLLVVLSPSANEAGWPQELAGHKVDLYNVVLVPARQPGSPNILSFDRKDTRG